jgi:hypothetical protein
MELALRAGQLHFRLSENGRIASSWTRWLNYPLAAISPRVSVLGLYTFKEWLDRKGWWLTLFGSIW